MGICICICITAIIISLIMAGCYYMENIKDLNDDVVMSILETQRAHDDQLKTLDRYYFSCSERINDLEKCIGNS